jgi:hypothetical protein
MDYFFSETRQLLKDKWGFDRWMFPLSGDKPVDAECFEDEIFFKECGLQKLIKAIKNLDNFEIEKIAELCEDSRINTDDLRPYEPFKVGEVIYCNDKVEWAVYFSHENSVTIFGVKLINSIKKEWSDFDNLKVKYD